MDPFILYNKLVNIANLCSMEKDLDKQVALTINTQLTCEQIQTIYYLILHHANIKGLLTRNCPPYNGKYNKKSKGVLYKFEDLPDELRKIILQYVINLSM